MAAGQQHAHRRFATLLVAVAVALGGGTGPAWGLARHGAPGPASSLAVPAVAARTVVVPAVAAWTVVVPTVAAAPVAAPTVAAPTVAAAPVAAAPVAVPAVAAEFVAAASVVGPSTASAAATTATSSPASGTPFRVVGLGDSVPAGNACGCTSYVTLAGEQAARRAGRPAAVVNLARGGLTTAGLVRQLGEAAASRAVAAADLVIVTIGANDFDEGEIGDAHCAAPALTCFRPTLARQPGQLDDVLDRIAALQAGHGGQVLVTGYWNDVLDGRVGRARGARYVATSDALTRADNAVIAAAAARHQDRYVDLYTPFKGNGTVDDTALLAADGDHPNAAGHRLIASTVKAVLG
jgi:lysophospholipase L1-like esterase